MEISDLDCRAQSSVNVLCLELVRMLSVDWLIQGSVDLPVIEVDLNLY